MTKHFLTLADIDDWPGIWKRAAALKKNRLANVLAKKSVAIVLEKPSTRTRVSFEVGVHELGGFPIILATQGSQIARGEPIEDTARVLSGYCHAIVIRTFGQSRVEAMARHASVPVINGLTDEHHPCQIASDLFTVIERFGRTDGLRYAWIGDGNNMANSWIEAAGLLGFELTLACPEGYRPIQPHGGNVRIVSDLREAVRGAHVVSTDVWASMGQEEEAEARRRAFAGYCLDASLMALAAPDAIVLHCLPAHRGEEITADVLEGPQSAVWQQAENRLHVQKALLERIVVP